MAKRGKRGKKRLAKLRKKLGFAPSVTKIGLPRFGSIQERIEAHGHACTLDKSKHEMREQEDRKRKQRGWDD